MNSNSPLPARRIWYVGLKGQSGGETAFIHLTNIRWFDGDVHDIPSAIASQMLAHPDVFSDKSPEERELLAEQARLRAAQVQADAAKGQPTSLESLLGSLPAGTTITLPNGIKIEVPAGGLTAAPAAAGAVSLEGAHTSSMAQRLAQNTGATNEDGAPTTPLGGSIGDATGQGFGAGDELVKETTTGNVDAANISLAPGSTIAAAPTAAPAPAAAPTASSSKPTAAKGHSGKAK